MLDNDVFMMLVLRATVPVPQPEICPDKAPEVHCKPQESPLPGQPVPVASVIGFLKGKSGIAIARLSGRDQNCTGEPL